MSHVLFRRRPTQNPAPWTASLPRQDAVMEDDALLRTTADRLEALATRTTTGDWRIGGLLATRPEVIAHRDGGTEHVAEARAGTAAWITALSPAVAAPLAAWLRAAASVADIDPAAVAVARVLVGRLPG
jgi:hypothetical protein